MASARKPILRGVTLAAQGEHPEDPAWRADALAQSPHSRLLDSVPRPLQDFDLERSRLLCAQIARQALADFAPALVLLPRRERRRAQTLLAFAYTLFDFARQRGVEGERLAQINRWEYTLEEALAGEAVGQPVFVAMGAEAARQPWPPDALRDLLRSARRRVTAGDSSSESSNGEELDGVARAVTAILVGEDSHRDLRNFAAALLRLSGDAKPLSAEERDGAAREFADFDLAHVPADYRRASRFLQLAAARVLADPARRPLGLGVRLVLLVRARWGRG